MLTGKLYLQRYKAIKSHGYSYKLCVSVLGGTGGDSLFIYHTQISFNAKNEAYSFILSHDLFTEFVEFCNNSCSDDPHSVCLSYLLKGR